MKTRHHMQLSVRGAIRNRMFDGFINEDGTPATREDAEEYLMDQLAEGHELLPMSRECEGFDYIKGCPGHPMEDSEDS